MNNERGNYKMIISTNSSRDQKDNNNNIEAKQEGNDINNIDERKVLMSNSKGLQTAAAASSSTSSRQWSGFRNPRIVRVSRSFGGKDRHSKVCTIRGLRDRRIRLSVPTAIQLYDLQDRLGLSQPSKVIDWLLDATKHDIDKLPPLQLPQGFGQFHQQQQQPMLFSQEPNMGNNVNNISQSFFDVNPMAMELDPTMGAKRYSAAAADQKGKWVKGSSTDHHQHDGNSSIGNCGKILSFMDRRKDDESGSVYHDGIGAAAASLPGLLNNAMPPPFNSYYHWDPSSLSLSQFGNHGFLPSQTENFLNGSTNPSLALPAAAHAAPQLFFCPPSTMPSLFPTFPPTYVSTPTAPAADSSCSHESRQMINHFQLLSSNTQHSMLPTNSAMPMKPFSLNVNAGSHTQNDDESLADDDDNTD